MAYIKKYKIKTPLEEVEVSIKKFTLLSSSFKDVPAFDLMLRKLHARKDELTKKK